MHRITVSSLLWDNLTKEVPQTIEEYNALAPKRDNPVLEDAIGSELRHGTFPKFRDKTLDALEKETGIKRINHGTEKEPQWESDMKFVRRLVAETGLSEEDFAAKYQSLAQTAMDAAAFNPAVRESTGEGPKVGKKDKENAEEVIKRGEQKTAEVAAALGAKLGRTVSTDVDSLARAFADYRRAKAREIEAATKAELGV